MTWTFKDDYTSAAFATVTVLSDSLFDEIVRACWNQTDGPGPSRLEVFDESNVSILYADAADFAFECGQCGDSPGNIGAGAIVWSVPGLTINNEENADLIPFCSACCASQYRALPTCAHGVKLVEECDACKAGLRSIGVES